MRESAISQLSLEELVEAVMINTRIVSCKRYVIDDEPFDIIYINSANIKRIRSLVSNLHPEHKDLLDTDGSFINYNIFDRALYAMKRTQIYPIETAQQ
jgi:hypothetical protein